MDDPSSRAREREAMIVEEQSMAVLKGLNLDKEFEKGTAVNDELMRRLHDEVEKETLAKIEAEDESIIKAAEEEPGLIDTIWVRLQSIRHLLLGIVFAYYLGLYGFHMFWILGVCWMVYALDAQYKVLGFKHYFRTKKAKKEANKDLVDAEGMKKVDVPEWFNDLMVAVWPNIATYAAGETQKTMSVLIKQILADLKPPAVHSVSVRSVSFAGIPPEMKLMKSYKAEREADKHWYKCDMLFQYGGDLAVTVVAVVGNSTVVQKIPVTVRDIRVRFPVRIELEFFPEFPFLKKGKIALFDRLDKHWLDFNVRVGSLNVLAFPALKEWVVDTITTEVENQLAPPRKIEFVVGGDPEVPGATGKQKKERKAVSLKPGERNPFVQYRGHARVAVVGCTKSLIRSTADGKNCEAYCKLFVNDVWHKTPTSPTATWNGSVFYDFPLELSETDQILRVRVKEWDATGKSEHLGSAEINLSKLEKDQQVSITAELVHPTKLQKGSISLIVTHSPDKELELQQVGA